MKKSFLFGVVIACLCALFFGCKKKGGVTVGSAESSGPSLGFSEIITGYDNLMNKAKEYEQKENFVYALGYYFDASQEKDASENNKVSAKQALDLLAEKLKNGEVGLKEQTVFGINDALTSLKFAMYKYFTEFCAFDFIFSIEKQTNIDYENRTADYLACFSCKDSAKYKEIKSAVYNAFENLPYYEAKVGRAAHFDENDFNTDYSEAIIQSGYLTNGMAFFSLNNPNISNDLLVSALAETDPYSGQRIHYNGADSSSLYFFDFTVLDSNGNEIQKFKNFPCFGISALDFTYGTVDTTFTTKYGGFAYDTSNRMQIKNVPSQYMQDFENGTIILRLDALYLPYGSFPYGEGTIDNIQNAKKIKMPVRENILRFEKY